MASTILLLWSVGGHVSRAVIYTRISQDDDRTELGVARQERACRDLAERAGHEVVAIYSDNDISASTLSRKQRPGWLALQECIRAGLTDLVIAHSTSRLSRRTPEFLAFIGMLDDHRVQLQTVSAGSIDVSTADGRQLLTILAATDTAEAERAAARIREKHLELAEAGRYVGPRPFGWDIVGTGAAARLIVNEREAAVVRECVDRLLDGQSLWAITKWLNAKGIPTSRGNPWKSQVVRRMLLREANIGIRVHTPVLQGKPRGVPRRFPGQWDAIVDPGKFVRVQSILTDPSRRSNNRGTEPVYLLTSVALCGVCGLGLVGSKEYSYRVKGYLRRDGSRGPSRTRTYPAAYKCSNQGCMRVQSPMSPVDRIVTEVLLGVLERDGVRILGGNADEAKRWRDETETLEARLRVAADQFADGVIGSDQLARISQSLRPRIGIAQARYLAAQPAPANAEFAGPGLRGAWAQAPIDTRKRLISTVGMRITILPVGSGNGAVFDPARVQIGWEA